MLPNTVEREQFRAPVQRLFNAAKALRDANILRDPWAILRPMSARCLPAHSGRLPPRT
jgi:hypothetical protein